MSIADWFKDPEVKVVKAHPDGLVEAHKACALCVAKDVELARLRDENRRLAIQAAQKPEPTPPKTRAKGRKH